MGDFDRVDNSAKPNDTKKMVIVLVLGVVLIALVSMQFMKNGGAPQAAAGAPVNNGMALPPPVVNEEISPQSLATMMADLQNDPTGPLLRQAAPSDRALDAVPRNPFRMSGPWLNSLLRLAPQPAAFPQPAATRTFNPPTAFAGPQSTALRPEDYKLTGVLNSSMAVLNGRVLKVGDLVGKARVIDIRDNGVTLQSADLPGGPTLELSLQPRLNQD